MIFHVKIDRRPRRRPRQSPRRSSNEQPRDERQDAGDTPEGQRQRRRAGERQDGAVRRSHRPSKMMKYQDDRGWRPWLHDRLCRREHRELAKLLHERAVVHSPQWRSLVGWRWLSATESAMQKSHGCHLRFSSINLYWLFAATIYYIIKYMSSMSLNQYYYRLEL